MRAPLLQRDLRVAQTARQASTRMCLSARFALRGLRARRTGPPHRFPVVLALSPLRARWNVRCARAGRIILWYSRRAKMLARNAKREAIVPKGRGHRPCVLLATTVWKGVQLVCAAATAVRVHPIPRHSEQPNVLSARRAATAHLAHGLPFPACKGTIPRAVSIRALHAREGRTTLCFRLHQQTRV